MQQSQAVRSNLAQAMSHPLRAEIFAAIGKVEQSPSELAKLLKAKLADTAYHCRRLERLGVAEVVRTREVRGAREHFFRSCARPFLSDEQWGEVEDKDAVSAIGMRMINTAAREAVEAATFDSRPDRHLSVTELALDERGWEDVVGILADALDQVLGVQGEAANRIAEGAESFRASVSILGFELPAKS